MPAPPSHDFAAGLLIDQGERIAESRADPARVEGLVEFLESLVGANSIALAEYSAKPGEPTLRTHGGFVNDGRALLPAISDDVPVASVAATPPWFSPVAKLTLSWQELHVAVLTV